jgi:DNA-binding CsgD family transcriptional regulator
VVAALLDPDRVHATFLVPRDDTTVGAELPVDAGLLRVTALNCSAQPPGHLRAVVLLGPPPPLHGLTRWELRILGLLVQGWPLVRIAAALHATVHAVAGHVAHITVKLGAQSRVVAVMRAQRQGLYLPADLAATPQDG